MAKAVLGKKLSCQSCDAKFYDLKKIKPVCPACETEYAPAKPKARRAAPEPAPKESGDPAAAEIAEALIETDGDDKNQEGLMEDTSDIGHDDTDVAGVIENVDGAAAEKT